MKRRNFFKTALIGTGAIALTPALALGQDPLASIRQYYYNWYIAPRDYNIHVPSNNFWQLLSECAEPKPRKDWGDVYGIIPVYRRAHTNVDFRDYTNIYQYRNGRNHIFWMNVEDYVFYKELERDAVFDFNQTHLLGVELIRGLIDPLNPSKNVIRPVDSYEIHVMYQKKY